MNWKYKIQKFMSNRYGPDELYKFLFILYIISFIINIFVNNIILEVLGLIIVLYAFFRVFSKNILQRKKENKIYLELKNNIIKPFKIIERNIKDKDNVYKKCSKCKTILKLPIPTKKGIKHTTCPKCKHKITLLTLKEEKIEIIKNK